MELDLDLSLSFGSAWIAESKVQLISFMATCVGVMLFYFVSSENKLSRWLLSVLGFPVGLWCCCNQTISSLQ